MILSCVASYSVSVQMMSVMRATASSLSPSIGAGTATVTAPLPMYTTQSEKSLASSRFSICVSCIEQVAIAAIAFILLELAQAQMTREIFPKAPLKYMPPTKFMTGNIFRGHIQDALFNIVGIWTHQGLQLLGMPTEAIHTPFMSDRFLSIENANYIFNNLHDIGEEVEFKEGGIIRTRAKEVLDNAIALLKEMTTEGLFNTLEQGKFGDVKRPKNGGKGLDGVTEKGANYMNPFVELMKGRK